MGGDQCSGGGGPRIFMMGGFTSMGVLARHKRAVHEGVKYPCGQCGHQASSKGNLALHKRAVHEGVKYPCNICKFQAAQKRYLKIHKMKKHMGGGKF